jgi:diguanylate cyclase (GGDEF)-like protein
VASQNQLKLIRFFDRSDELSFTSIRANKGEGVSGFTWKEGKGFRYNKRKDWGHLESEHTPPRAESALSVPIVRNDQIVGIISIYSRQKHAFLHYQFMLVTILGNYLGVAIANARHYEKTKEESIRCGLTGLYNFRYFEDKIHDIFQKMQDPERDPISLVLLDIDHFKKVNDTYGHESGNEILCQIAACLESQFEDIGIVARYGGEEFVILLPNVSPLEAYGMAEKLRLHIANHPFTACEHILDYDESVRVGITASIGVASYPNDCEEPLELIRHADRAMYMGAKRRGRNRVATYANMKTAAEL